MSADRKGRRWLTATVVTAAIHLVVFLGLVIGTPRGGPEAQAPIFQVTLERDRQPPPPPKVSAAARAASPSPLRLHQPPAVAPSAPSSDLPSSPAVAVPAPSAPPAPAPVSAPKLKLDCLSMGPAARKGVYGREDCDVQRYAKPSGPNPVFATPSNPAWDAEIANRMRKHEPLPPEQPNRGDCANSNLGMGCPGDMLIPLVKRKF